LLFAFPTLIQAATLNCPCKVVEVSDGDTVYVLDQSRSSRKIWLLGIDAPQARQKFGSYAKQNLIKLVKGEYVDVEYDKRDRYGRIFGKVMKSGHDMNLQQIRDGYAWHYKIKPEEQTRQDFVTYRDAEDEARKNRMGLWSSPAIPPWEFRKQN
jgi:endonuclease YncB( thermonuclease family)